MQCTMVLVVESLLADTALVVECNCQLVYEAWSGWRVQLQQWLRVWWRLCCQGILDM